MALSFIRFLRPAALALIASGVAATANAQQGARVGLLQCDVAGGPGSVVASSKALQCTFRPNGGEATEVYVGTINRYGVDVGVTGPGRLAWGVFAPTSYPGPGALTGVYSGVSGGATVGIGGTANLLYGGNSGTFGLQGLSVSGQTGLNLTAAVSQMTLEYAPPPRMRRQKSRRHHRRY